jgi:hypothetical protein
LGVRSKKVVIETRPDPVLCPVLVGTWSHSEKILDLAKLAESAAKVFESQIDLGPFLLYDHVFFSLHELQNFFG